MNEESMVMKAVFTDMRALRTAAWLAKQGSVSVLRLARKGDMMEIVGTDSYVMLQAPVPCDFVDWPEGAVAVLESAFEAEAVCKVVGGSPDAWERPLTVSVGVSVERGEVTYTVEFSRSGRTGVRRSCRFEGTKDKLGDLDEIERSMAEGKPEGHIKSYMWGTVGQVVDRMHYAEWELVDHGPGAAFELKGIFGRILAMPSVRGEGYGHASDERKEESQ